MKSSNPAFARNILDVPSVRLRNESLTQTDIMTVNGAILKAMILVGLALSAGTMTFIAPLQYNLVLPGALCGFAISLVILFKATSAPMLAPVYAVVEGVVLSQVAQALEWRYPGIALQAVLATFGTLIGFLLIYRSKLIEVNAKFKMGLSAVTVGIALTYMVSLVGSYFGMSLGFLNSSSPLGIAASVFTSGVAAFNLLLDFDAIEGGARARAPKYMEWYSAFGLLLTLVWLYLEVLRLLSKVSGSRR